MKILVTGGAGFIGSNVVDGYVEEGHEVVVLDDLSSGERENVHPQARFYEIDIRSEEVAELIRKEKPDVLNHHAAQISVPESVMNPLLDADVNIKGFLNLLQAVVKHGVGKVIFISSGGAIYGEASEYPTSEGYPPEPLSPYAVAKYACEHYLSFYRHQYGLDSTTLRYANIYGPRQIPHGEAGVVAIFMDNLLKGRGSALFHFPQDEEGMIRDYCFVGDVVKANIAALSNGTADFFNIGTGKETKTGRLYQVIFEALREARPDVAPELAHPRKMAARPGDLPRSCLTAKKAANSLGWRPETDLETGVRKTLEWRLGQSS